MIVDIISWVLLLGGSFFLVVGAVGLVRLPDFFTRLHASGVTDSGGAGLILIGLMFQAGFTLVTAKLAITLLFIWFTSPTACHALAKAAVHAGLLKDANRGQRAAPTLDSEPPTR
ncbi:MAG: monovalent cation/H(+) antiporter subunit G [Gammaproteobacteria bacterium]